VKFCPSADPPPPGELAPASSSPFTPTEEPARPGAPGPSPAFSPAVAELRQGLRHLLSTEISTASAAVEASGGETHTDAAACL